jgi:hypothetical protein
MNYQQWLGNFNPLAGDIVVIRGSFNGWSGNANQCFPQDSLYVGRVNLSDVYVGTTIEYKFVIVQSNGTDIWEFINNRTYTVPAGGGIIPPVYFSNQTWAPIIDIEVLFRVNMEVQIFNGNFNPAVDWVVVRGNHPAIGNWGGATRLFPEVGNPNIYSDWIQFDNLTIGQAIEYKFVILENGNPNLAQWEQQDNRSFTPTGNEPDLLPPPLGNGYGEIMPELVYFSNITPAMVLNQNVLVTFQVDMQPAFNKLADPFNFIVENFWGDTVYSVEEVGVCGFFNNWPWGGIAPQYLLRDDGVTPDSFAGDKIYTGSIQFYAGDPTLTIYKYAINGYDVEAGFAMNHETIIDDSLPTFILPQDVFGSPDTLYNAYLFINPFVVDLVPHNPPINIPAGGGNFIYDLNIDNGTPWAFFALFWIDVTLPNGTIFPILQRPNLFLPVNVNIIRNNMTQSVPAGAPAGLYHYNAYMKNILTQETFAIDCFTFTKLPGGNYVEGQEGWSLQGWEEIATASSPEEFRPLQVYPNPFNSSLAISFQLPVASDIKLKMYDISGREVASIVNGRWSMGEHKVEWEAEGLTSGIYFVRLSSNSCQLSASDRQLLVLKVVLMK